MYVLMGRNVRLIAVNVDFSLTQIAFVSIKFEKTLVKYVAVKHFVYIEDYDQGVWNVVRGRSCVSMNRFVTNV